MSPARPRLRLLVTGFGPFPGVPLNPSAELARSIAGSPRLTRVLGAPPKLLVMRTAYGAIADELEPALVERPDAVLMIGVARRARQIRVETRARNRASRLYPDASGRTHALVLVPGAPAERRGREAARIRMILRRGGIEARLSRDAGRYLCNASYFRVLAEGCPAVFLHIPPLPAAPALRARMLERWTRGCVAAALSLVRPVRLPASRTASRAASGSRPGAGSRS